MAKTKKKKAPQPTEDDLEKMYALASLESEQGYLKFLDHVVVDAQPQKLPFRTIAEQWQWERSIRSSGALDNLAGILPSYHGPRSFWNEYHKGSDKTHDDARELCFLLGWSKRRLLLYVGAGGEDQAALLTDAMKGIINDNPWIGERVKVTELTAKSEVNESELTILSMNAYGDQGIFPDYFIASEVTHWKYQEGKTFWNFIMSSINKRPLCVTKVETNAGMKGSWQWEERERIRVSKYWSFYAAPEGDPLPSWMDNEKIADDSKGMEPGERDRLYKNRWVDPGEIRGYLSLGDAQGCEDETLQERWRGEYHIEYIVVLDYGGVYDRCSLGIHHILPPKYIPDTSGQVSNYGVADEMITDRMDCWQGTHENRIDINIPTDDQGRELLQPDGRPFRSVEGWIETTRKHFRIGALVLDPTQLEGLAIKYERKGLKVVRFNFRQGQANHYMAQLLKNHVQNRKCHWSKDAGRLPPIIVIDGKPKTIEDDTLAKELSMLIVKPMAYGYKFDHEAGRHNDRAVNLGMALVYALPQGSSEGMQVGPTVVPPQDPRTGNTLDSTKDLNQAIKNWNLYGLGRDPQQEWDKW